MSQQHSGTQWGSRFGFILASAGSAIGLGAIWKFPYWAGTYGGANFIIPFILFTFTIGIALLLGELAIGRAGRGSALNALRKRRPRLYGFRGHRGFNELCDSVLLLGCGRLVREVPF